MAEQKLIVAHRGGASQWHENTVEAIQHAIERGADMVEIDVRRTADGKLVVHHDESIGDCVLARVDYNEAVHRSSALGYRIPLLAEILQMSHGRILLDLEIKEAGYEVLVLGALSDFNFKVGEFVITSFDSGAIETAKGSQSEILTGLLVGTCSGSEALDRFRHVRADFLAPRYELLDSTMLRDAATAMTPLLPWTVNDAPRMADLLREPSVFGIITDSVAAALQARPQPARRIADLEAFGLRRRLHR
jgi:glycerophosphoryl diester phosphodiesterase